MYPVLFKIGPLSVYSFGVMQGLGALVGTIILYSESKRKNLDIYFTLEVVLLAILSELVGGKILFLIEHWDAFLADPIYMAIIPSGSTFYGGFILGFIVFYIYLKRKKIPFLFAADTVAPSLAVAYALGRMGCHLSGDGDYGIPTNLPWAVNYEHGTMPPSIMFRGTDIAKTYPGGVVPDNTPLHPTSVYEFIAALIIFTVLWKNRKKTWANGKLFSLYLILTSVSRFLVEFIRLNPKILSGLTEAQIISIVLGSIGLFGFYKLNSIKNNVIEISPSQK